MLWSGLELNLLTKRLGTKKAWRNVEADSKCSILFQKSIKERKKGKRGIKNAFKIEYVALELELLKHSGVFGDFC